MTLLSSFFFSSSKPKIVSDGGGSSATVYVKENTRFVTDVQTSDKVSSEEHKTLSYFIVGGSDKHLFDVDRYTGEVFFKNAPDYEYPVDYGHDNKYQVKIKVVDAAGYSDTQWLNVKVKDVFESDVPEIISNGGGDSADIHIDENTLFVTDVQTFDTISTEENKRLSYSIVGGADKDLFEINEHNGQVFFKDAPDFENPLDFGQDNTYNVEVKVVDGAHFFDTQVLNISVKDVEEGIVKPEYPNPPVVGTNEDDFLEGTQVDGVDVADVINGRGGNDVLLGGGGRDHLFGTGTATRGVGEIDNLTGGADADVFILGDQNGAFYVGNGFNDFAIIRDFSAGEDQLLLSGGAGDYTTAAGGNGNTFILSNGDAIANVLNTAPADIDLSEALYV